MAKVAIKYDNIVPYGGIFYAMNEFRRTGLGKLVDGRLNVRCANYGFQYSDIMLALFCVYLCGGDHIEDITTILNKYLSTAPNARIPSSDTIARGLKELRALSIAYTSKTGSIYAHDPALKLNSLLLDMTLLLGLLKRGQYIDVDFDNEFIPTEKSDALYSYKKKRGYFPGVMTSGPLIIGIENRQGNSNVKFEQVEELSRMLDNIESHGLYVRMFRADCGSFIKELVEELFLRTETFYLRASSCADRRQMYEQCKDWRHTSVNGQEMDVTSFEFTDFLSDWHLRLVVQRTKMDAEQGEQFLPGMEYTMGPVSVSSDVPTFYKSLISACSMRIEDITCLFITLTHRLLDLFVTICGTTDKVGNTMMCCLTGKSVILAIEVDYTSEVRGIAHIHCVCKCLDRWLGIIFARLQILIEDIIGIISCDETLYRKSHLMAKECCTDISEVT